MARFLPQGAVYSRSMTTKTSSPLGAFLSWVAPIEAREVRAVVAAFSLFFFMWAGYFAVRPVRETVAINFIGRENVADLWLYTALFSILIIPAYGAIVARLRRSVFLPAIYGAVALLFAGVGVAMQTGGMTSVIGKVFYVFISVMNLMLLSMFWSFLLDLFDKGQTKRLFGVIAAGGSAGALAGPFISDLAVGAIGASGVLYLGAVMFVAAIVCQRVLLGVWTDRSSSAGAAEERPIGGNVFAGLELVLSSRYLMGIALFIVGISTVSTLLYFEQLRLVEVTFADQVAQTRAFARIDWIVQAITVVSQILVTGRLAARFGVSALLTIVPAAMVLGFLALAGSSGFVLFVIVFVLRRAGEYAFVRPGREMLWSPLDSEAKYKAKNAVDVPVYRGADYVVAQAQNAIAGAGVSAPALMLMGAVAAALWGLVGFWLGKRFRKLEASDTPAARRTYKVYLRGESEYEVVKQGLSWPALLFTPIWAWSKGMVWVGFGLLGLSILIDAIAMVADIGAGLGAAVGLGYLIWVGNSGNAWLARSLEKRGYRLIGEIAASSRAAALEQISRSADVRGIQPSPELAPRPSA